MREHRLAIPVDVSIEIGQICKTTVMENYELNIGERKAVKQDILISSCLGPWHSTFPTSYAVVRAVIRGLND